MSAAAVGPDWTCAVCQFENREGDETCYCCRMPRKEAPRRKSALVAGRVPSRDGTPTLTAACAVAAAALLFVAPGLAILFIVLSIPLVAAMVGRSGFEGVVTSCAIALGVGLATAGACVAALFVICSGGRGGGGGGFILVVLAPLVTFIWLTVAIASRGRRRREERMRVAARESARALAREADRVFGGDDGVPQKKGP